jgi:hypothetical protein
MNFVVSCGNMGKILPNGQLRGVWKLSMGVTQREDTFIMVECDKEMGTDVGCLKERTPVELS